MAEILAKRPEDKKEGLEGKLAQWREFAEQAREICRQLQLKPWSAEQSSEVEWIEGYIREMLDYIENPVGPDPSDRLRNKAMSILGPLQVFKLKNKDLVGEETGRLIDSLARLAPSPYR